MPNPTPPVLLALLLVLIPHQAQSQRLEPGARVRVRPSCDRDAPCDPIIGRLQSVEGDTVMLIDSNGQRRTFPLTRTTRFDLSHGMRSRWIEGAGYGLLVGLATGFVGKELCELSQEAGSLCGLTFFATIPAGALLGAVIAAPSKTELWLPARRATLVVRPTPSGVGLGMRLAF